MTLDHPHQREAGSAQEAQEASKATFGFLLTALGVALLADRLLIIDLNLGQLWPLILIMIGVSKLNSPERWEGAWWIGIGSWWLVITTTALTLRTTWPVLIIISGVLMIAESLAQSAARPAARPDSHDNAAPVIDPTGDPMGDNNGQ